MKTLEKLATKKTTMACLNTVRVNRGMAMATDLDNWIASPTTLPDGLYSGAGVNSGSPIISAIDPADLPIVPSLGELNKIHSTFARETVLRDIAWIAKAMSDDYNRYALNGMFFAKNGDIVATDGHRLHMLKGFHGHSGVIIPANTIDLLLAMVKEDKSTKHVSMYTYKDYVVFHVGESTLTCKPIDGSFPNYTAVIPEKNPNKAQLDVTEIQAIAKRVKLLVKAYNVGKHSTYAHTIAINGAGTATWASGSQVDDTPPVIETMPCSMKLKTVTGFNVHYLADALSGTVSYDCAKSPIRIDNGNLTAVIMPVRL